MVDRLRDDASDSEDVSFIRDVLAAQASLTPIQPLPSMLYNAPSIIPRSAGQFHCREAVTSCKQAYRIADRPKRKPPFADLSILQFHDMLADTTF